jgi:glycosyltransferase involved in cell wall biosynthesis
MAGGLAVIASDVGGTSEIVEQGISGMLFRPGDAGHMADQMRALVENGTLRKEVAEEGQRRVIDGYSLEHMVDNLERFLERALSEDRAAKGALPNTHC